MTARPPSLLHRIAIRLTLVTLGAAVLCYAWVFYQIRVAADRVAEGSLVSQAREIAAELRWSTDGISLVLPETLDVTLLGSGRLRYAVSDERGRALLVSAWPVMPLPQLQVVDPQRQLYEVFHRAPQPEAFFGAVYRTEVGSRPVMVQVERYGQHWESLIDTVLEEFFTHGAWVALPFLATLLLISLWTIRGAIAPLKQLSRHAAAIGPTTTTVRLAETDLPREILPLVRAMNSALDRLEAGFRVQREFTADAAHELRTPLAILRAHIDALADAERAAALRQDVDRMGRVVSQLLRDAQLDALAIGAAESAELAEIALEVACYVAPLAAAQGKGIEAQIVGPRLLVRGNRESIQHAVRNIVENAVRHTAAATAVEIVVDGARVTIIDRGPGIPAELREHVFRRFWRARRDEDGAGLGLSIVRKTMAIHGGTVSIASNPGGGAAVSLLFPAPPPEPPAASRMAQAAE